jgi:dTDP-4-dehydrorhamnose reductase/SAM-dependent methyltransferase
MDTMEPSLLLNNALITGGSGMIGHNINFGIKPSSSELNICDKHSIDTYILNRCNNIDCIIHLAATNLRESEQNPTKSIHVNIIGTTNMLSVAMRLNIPFILISTGAVFSTNNTSKYFNETHATCPNSMYGCTKSSSEYIALLYAKTIVIRTGWLFGGNQKNHYKFVENVLKHLLTNNEISASTDFYGSPTYVLDFIEKMKYLIDHSKFGIHHVVNDGKASGYEIATEVAKLLNLETGLIIPTKADEIPNAGPKRSNSEVLETINEYNKMRYWKDALKDYVDKYMNEHTIITNTRNGSITTNQPWSDREQCRFCNKYNLHIFFHLKPTPPANHFTKSSSPQDTIPLNIAICQDCNHIQLMQIVVPSFQYSHYFYVSSTSNTMVKHLTKNVFEFTQMLNISKSDNILEIGANDGLCVRHLLDNGFTNVIGIDPASNINKRHELPIICDFFGSNVINKLKYNSFKLIYAFHCCAHIEDINDVFNTIYKLLDDNGTFIMEVGYFYEVFKNKLFDTIYHEHIDYHTCTAIIPFSQKHNLRLFNVKTNDIQGGSIQFFFCKVDSDKSIEPAVYQAIQNEKEIGLHEIYNLSNWKNQIIRCGNDINYLLNSFVHYGKVIVGYGASAKSTTFMYQYNLTNKLIDYIIDDSKYKQNYLSPGLHIPIKPFDILETNKVDYIIILSWNFANEIIQKLSKYRDHGLRIILPFPEIKII